MDDPIFDSIPIQIDPRVHKDMTHCLMCNVELKLIDTDDEGTLCGELVKVCQKCNRIYILTE